MDRWMDGQGGLILVNWEYGSWSWSLVWKDGLD
jgi:hypothetical protein